MNTTPAQRESPRLSKNVLRQNPSVSSNCPSRPDVCNRPCDIETEFDLNWAEAA